MLDNKNCRSVLFARLDIFALRLVWPLQSNKFFFSLSADAAWLQPLPFSSCTGSPVSPSQLQSLEELSTHRRVSLTFPFHLLGDSEVFLQIEWMKMSVSRLFDSLIFKWTCIIAVFLFLIMQRCMCMLWTTSSLIEKEHEATSYIYCFPVTFGAMIISRNHFWDVR